MRKLSFTEITRKRLSPEESERLARFPISVLLDNIRSLYNVGSIFRTADAARVDRLYLTGITGTPPRKEIDKTALGAVESVPWEYHSSPVSLIKSLKNQGIAIVVLEHTDNSISYKKLEYKFPLCLIVGNEVFGVQEEIIALADDAIEIPMFGVKQSLNVSVAFGVVIYEILFQYLKENLNEDKHFLINKEIRF